MLNAAVAVCAYHVHSADFSSQIWLICDCCGAGMQLDEMKESRFGKFGEGIMRPYPYMVPDVFAASVMMG